MAIITESLVAGGIRTIKLDKAELLLGENYPEAKHFQEGTKSLVILGSPIYGERMAYDLVKERLFGGITDNFIRDIKGAFLFILHDKKAGQLQVISDRFASIPFFYRVDRGRFYGATNYSDIWRAFRGRAGFRVNEEAFYEFLCMRRLFGNKTYDRDTLYMDSASILHFSSLSGRCKVSKYWQPSCAKNNLSARENTERLAFLMKQSFNRVTSDGKRYGLLLSGGLDSRAVLAASDKPMKCITTCEYRNNEVAVAEELSRLKGYEHLFIRKPQTYYSDIVDKAVYVSGGMSIYVNSHLFNVEKAAREHADVLLSGYGFDFLFRGKYLPHSMPLHLKKLTYWRNLMPLEQSHLDVAEEFIDNLGFRLKTIDPWRLVRHTKRKEMHDALYHSINGIVAQAKGISDDPYKWWDYCSFHNVSRHYSWPNLLCLRSFTEERTVALDNDLFDMFWGLDVSMYHNGKIFKDAVKLLDEKIYNVRNANTNLRFGDPPLLQTAKIGINKALKETRLNRIFKWSIPPPSAKERSWPIDKHLIRQNEAIKGMAQDLCVSGSLDRLSFLDMDTISSCVKEHLEAGKDHTNLILSLITLDRFLRI